MGRVNTGTTPAWPTPGQSIDAQAKNEECNRTPLSASGGLWPSEGWCERLYHAKAAELILYGRALGLSHAEAEDVLQETFLALLQKETAPENPTHYCVRSFRNRVLNHRRSFWRRITREFESKRWFEHGPDESPVERKAMRCLARLPVDQREVIVLKLWHKLTFEEIGQLLELSPNTAAGRYRYGMEKLRACMKSDPLPLQTSPSHLLWGEGVEGERV